MRVQKWEFQILGGTWRLLKALGQENPTLYFEGKISVIYSKSCVWNIEVRNLSQNFIFLLFCIQRKLNTLRANSQKPLRIPQKKDDKEEKIQQALDAYAADSILSVRKLANLYGIPKTTLHNCISAKTLPAKQAHEAQQVLSDAEEAAIGTWIKKWDDFGFPPRRRHVYQMVQGLLRSWNSSDNLGEHWLQRFLGRHSDLDSKVGKTLDKETALATDLDSFKIHQDHFYHIKCKFHVSNENTWNTDEKGFAIGIGGAGVLVCCVSRRNPSIIQDGGGVNGSQLWRQYLVKERYWPPWLSSRLVHTSWDIIPILRSRKRRMHTFPLPPKDIPILKSLSSGFRWCLSLLPGRQMASRTIVSYFWTHIQLRLKTTPSSIMLSTTIFTWFVFPPIEPISCSPWMLVSLAHLAPITSRSWQIVFTSWALIERSRKVMSFQCCKEPVSRPLPKTTSNLPGEPEVLSPLAEREFLMILFFKRKWRLRLHFLLAVLVSDLFLVAWILLLTLIKLKPTIRISHSLQPTSLSRSYSHVVLNKQGYLM